MEALLPLAISLALLCLLFGVKYWESRMQVVLAPRTREWADRLVVRLTGSLEGWVKRLLRAFSRKVVIGGLQWIAERLLAMLQWIERKLVQLLGAIRGEGRDVPRKREVSSEKLRHLSKSTRLTRRSRDDKPEEGA